MSFVFFQFMPMIPGLTSISAGITDNLINALIGGAMSGIGIAIIITQLSINKYKNISPGRIYLVCDSLIVMSILLVNDKTLADVVYGFVEIIAFSYAVDMFLTGSQQSVQTLILSEHNDEIATRLQTLSIEGNRSVKSVQWSTEGSCKMLMVVSRKGYSGEIVRTARAIDPDVILMTVPVTAVYGIDKKNQ